MKGINKMTLDNFEIRRVDDKTWEVVCWKEDHSYCFTIGWLEYNKKEPCFELRSVGLRWCEDATESLNEFVVKWADMMLVSLVK